MKNTYLFCALACALLLAGCSGGGGKSGLKKNDYLGSLPVLYADQELAAEALEADATAKAEKLMAGGESNYDRVQPIFDKAIAAKEELEAQFKADVKAELERLADTPIPVTFSAALQASDKFFYEVPEAKLIAQNGRPAIVLTIRAKGDLNVPGMRGYDYQAYYRLLCAEGVVERSPSVILPVSLERAAQSFAAGTPLNPATILLNFSHAAQLASFTGVEFITREEYETK